MKKERYKIVISTPENWYGETVRGTVGLTEEEAREFISNPQSASKTADESLPSIPNLNVKKLNKKYKVWSTWMVKI